MGYNSVVVVINDGLQCIQEDTTFGDNLAKAVSRMIDGRPQDVSATSTKGCTHVNAATVVSTAHADTPQVILVKHNFGWNLWENIPEDCLHDLRAVLWKHGYVVRKKPIKPGV